MGTIANKFICNPPSSPDKLVGLSTFGTANCYHAFLRTWLTTVPAMRFVFIGEIGMLKKLVLVAGVLLAIANSSHADIFFSQDFSSSNTLSDYFNLSSPTVNQFNGIQTSGIGTTATITNDDLVFTRVSGNSGSANRIALNGTTALSSSLVTFNLSAGGAAGTTAGVLSLGSGTDFGTQVSAPVNANIHSRIGINLTGAGFSLRSIGASTISAAFTGNQTVFWFTNNTGNAFNYLDPTSGSTTLANDVSDIWVGSTKVLTIAAQTGTRRET